jgi:hypothetical protein
VSPAAPYRTVHAVLPHTALRHRSSSGMRRFPFLLGTAIQHALERSNPIDTLGVADGSSRSLGTHQNPSTPSRAPMKQGPFAQVGLCCPDRRHYYDPLRLPLGSRPLRPHGLIGRRAARPRSRQGRGGSPQFPRQPSDRSTPPTPGGSSASAPGPRTPSMAFTHPRQVRLLLYPPEDETA